MRRRLEASVATLAVWAALAVAAGALGACASPRNTLGTTSSRCFRAVPVASEAVHDRGRMAGVRLVGSKELNRHPLLTDLIKTRVGHPLSQVCVVSFHGDYSRDQVERPADHEPVSGTGPVAIVIVTVPQNTLVATFILDHEPLPLRHEVLGAYSPAPPPVPV